MNTKQQMFGEYVEAVCKRPLMYTFKGTFAEVIMLLDSYAQGAVVFRHCGHHALDPFHRWLAKNKPQFEQVGGFVGWGDFWKFYQNDEVAIKDFREFYLEFQKTLNDKEEFQIRLTESEIQSLYEILISNLENETFKANKEAELTTIKGKLEEAWEFYLNQKRYVENLVLKENS